MKKVETRFGYSVIAGAMSKGRTTTHIVEGHKHVSEDIETWVAKPEAIKVNYNKRD